MGGLLVLLGLALVAGAATALTPCVLPVLPALLSASATGGRRRPLGIVAGLTATYALTIVALASILRHTGLSAMTLHDVAIAVLIGFGVSLIVPPLARLVARPLERLARHGPRSRGRGLWSGVGVGAALGLVYAPCAGPILAAVVSVSATRGTSAGLAAIGLAYALGSGVVLLALALGGRRITARLRRAGRGLGLQRALGVVLVLTGFAMAANLDTRLEVALAAHLPGALVDPTASLERSPAVEARLVILRGADRFIATASTPPPLARDLGGLAVAAGAVPAAGASSPSPEAAATLPDLGPAPDFAATQRWFNTPGDRPLTLARLRGHVVLVDFWTYSCINCIRTFGFLRALEARYRRDGLTIVGVHTPEFGFERDAGNVATAIAANHLAYPVVQDNEYATWNAWTNHSWPAEYLIDAQGHVRYSHLGEGDEAQTESAIRALLADSGHPQFGAGANASVDFPAAAITPETYLGAARATGFAGRPPTLGTSTYAPVRGGPGANRFALSGEWTVDRQAATAGLGATIRADVRARDVYLVAGASAGAGALRVRILLDGHPIGPVDAGRDVHDGVVTIARHRLYRLVESVLPAHHRLTLEPDPGVAAFVFTFG